MAAALAYQGDTIANPHESRSLDCFLAREARYLAPQFCRSRRKPRYSAGFQAEPGANCGSWAKLPRPREEARVASLRGLVGAATSAAQGPRDGPASRFLTADLSV